METKRKYVCTDISHIVTDSLKFILTFEVVY